MFFSETEQWKWDFVFVKLFAVRLSIINRPNAAVTKLDIITSRLNAIAERLGIISKKLNAVAVTLNIISSKLNAVTATLSTLKRQYQNQKH